MIQPIDLQDDTIVGLHVTGTITAADIQPWATLLDQKSKQASKLRAYIEYENVDTVTLRAAAQDIQFDITHLGDFEKVALVSDQSWTNLPAFIANVVPGLMAKQFSPAEKEQARQWIKS